MNRFVDNSQNDIIVKNGIKKRYCFNPKFEPSSKFYLICTEHFNKKGLISFVLYKRSMFDPQYALYKIDLYEYDDNNNIVIRRRLVRINKIINDNLKHEIVNGKLFLLEEENIFKYMSDGELFYEESFYNFRRVVITHLNISYQENNKLVHNVKENYSTVSILNSYGKVVESIDYKNYNSIFRRTIGRSLYKYDSFGNMTSRKHYNRKKELTSNHSFIFENNKIVKVINLLNGKVENEYYYDKNTLVKEINRHIDTIRVTEYHKDKKIITKYNNSKIHIGSFVIYYFPNGLKSEIKDTDSKKYITYWLKYRYK